MRWSALAWLVVWAVWMWEAPGIHANWTLGTTSTTALIALFAAVSYFNLLVLVLR